MLCRLTLALFFSAIAQSQYVFIGRLLDASQTPSKPVPSAKVTILATGQQQLTDSDGVFKLDIPKNFIPGTEIQLDVKAGNLRVYLPLDGVFNLPAPTAKPFAIQLLPAGSKLFLGPAVIESLLAQASKPAAQAPRPDANKKNEEPPLQRFIKDWAVKYGFSFEQVQNEVQTWGDQIRTNPEKSTLRQQALAAFEARNFEKSAELFHESAHEAGSEFDSLDAQSKALEEKKRKALRNYLDDEIRAAESLTNRFKFSEATDELAAASKRVPRDRYLEWWAEMQERMALASFDTGDKGEGARSITFLTKAVDAYQSALQVYKPDALPQDWARTQMNLGVAYMDLGERQSGEEGMKSLQASVNAYEQALTVYTKDALAPDWARTQINLGSVYLELGGRQSGEEGMKSLQASVKANEQALTVYTKDALPQDWARTQMNLGNTYGQLGGRQSGEEGMKSLQASVKAYEQALVVYTEHALPQDWANTQMNMGNAYGELGERQSGEEGMKSLQASVKAHEQALTVYTKNALPQDWARTEMNLGNAYFRLGERQSGGEVMKSLQASVKAYEQALTVYTKDALPQVGPGRR
jgi:tetratricopeptide (TPR) repeat protein